MNINVDLLKTVLETLSLVDLKEEPEEGTADTEAGILRRMLQEFHQQPIPSTGVQRFGHVGLELTWSKSSVFVAFSTGQKYNVAYQPDSNIIRVLRIDTLGVASAESEVDIDKALGLQTVELRLPTDIIKIMEDSAKSRGIILKALMRQVLVQEAASIVEREFELGQNLTMDRVAAQP